MKNLFLPFSVACAVLVGGVSFGGMLPANAQGAAPDVAPAAIKTRDEWKAFMAHFGRLRAKDPQGAIEQAREFLRLNPGSSAFSSDDVIWEIALAYHRDLKDTPRALAELDSAIETANSDNLMTLRLVPKRAGLMEKEAALAYLTEQWPTLQGAMYANPSLKWNFIPAYLGAYNAVGKGEESLKWLRQTVIANLVWADDNSDGFLANQLINALWNEGRDSEALSWAKLNWMLSGFDSKSLDNATQLLGRAFAAQDVGGTAKIEAFIKAQSDASAPNPLKDVPLPKWSDEERALLKSSATKVLGWSGARPKVSVNIALGEWRKAMLDARRALLNNPASPEGLEQMGRVFKAHDLNLVRANALLSFYKDKTGENPVEAFFKENPEPQMP